MVVFLRIQPGQVPEEPQVLNRKDLTLSETGKQPVVLRTVVCLVYEIREGHGHRKIGWEGRNVLQRATVYLISRVNH